MHMEKCLEKTLVGFSHGATGMGIKRKAGRPPVADESRKEQHQFRCPGILWEKAERVATERGYSNVAELIRQLLRELPEPK